ncbi:MAG: exodeoxyribonuclease V subunit gamma [Rhodoferax sp.]|nr:exodeoxyribonuclease V subunit gamma [Rhodoferax sp.]
MSNQRPLLQPGFLAFHSNRSELLAQVVISWLSRHPQGPLEEEVVLVQSNGMAEWVKMEMARMTGVCAATRVELPSRFLWRTYRQVLGREAVPSVSPLDKVPMVWRLMQLLPTLRSQAGFEPIAEFLAGDEAERMLQLAAKLADLFDQYQNYRADWLQAWAQGHDHLVRANGSVSEIPAEQRWQPQLWRAVLQTLSDRQRQSIRPQLQQQVVGLLQSGAPLASSVAQRVIVFGMSHIPLSTLQTLAALSKYSQVLLAIPNPCQYYWGDIMDGRELLQAQRRRQPLRGGQELSTLPLEDMHAHAHPLLAAWGRMGRDFIRQLDVFDDAEMAKKQFALARIDFFDAAVEETDTPLLRQVQNRIRDLVPLEEHRAAPIAAQDQSIVFHSAHSSVRELEILHDQLLHLLAIPNRATAIQPRDIIVMVPDIAPLAPAIRAVFGQYPAGDARYIPFDIADMAAKSSSPLIAALDWLLRVPAQRCRMSEWVDLLEVGPIASRFGIAQESLPKLTAWMVGAGIRWGLNGAHRSALDLGACGDQNSAWFGLRRMLLGYASGSVPVPARVSNLAAIEPYAEVGGLEAELAGSLAHLLQAVLTWWSVARIPASPAVWAQRWRALLGDMVKCESEPDKQALRALEAGLVSWLDACEAAGFDAEIALSVARSAWLEAVATPSLNQRFRAGGVTFCTLMPMRAIPFEVVCLLGMNDGDYPRRGSRSDFDLMELQGNRRAGDRSRRDDDRQLMLEALLSARQMFYVSWCGHSVRDNSVQAPSVLVSQLRDYLGAAWGTEVVTARTTQHPLQAFSRRYFEVGSPLLTYAREWRAAHAVQAHAGAGDSRVAAPPMAAFEPAAGVPLTISALTEFLRNPVKAFFRHRLQVVFDDTQLEDADDESFGLDGLQQYRLIGQLLATATTHATEAHAQQSVARSLARLRHAGELPLKVIGDLEQLQLETTLLTMLTAWRAECARFPHSAERQSVRLQSGPVVLEDWIDHLRSSNPEPAALVQAADCSALAWLELQPGKLLVKVRKGQLARPEKLLGAWVRSLAIAASGKSASGILVGRDGVVEIPPFPQDRAVEILQGLLQLWRDGMQAPLPLPPRTALALVAGKNAAAQFEGAPMTPGEVQDTCLARIYPDYAALAADGRFEALAKAVYAPVLDWVRQQVKVTAYATPADAEVPE